MAKKKAEKEPKPVKEKKAKEKKPKAKKAAAEKPSKKKKGKGKAEETAPETAAAAAETTAAEGQEEEEQPEKPRRSILQPVICVLIGLLAVFEVFMIFVWLTNPTSEELQAQREAAAAPPQAWSLSAYSNRHGYYQPPEASSPVAIYATNNDVPDTAQPRVQEPAPAEDTEPTAT